MEIRKAQRFAVPQIISISGPSGSGKTYSALLLAAGLAPDGGKVGFLDTENGRGCMYADSPGIVNALPQGYQYGELSAPFSPDRYIEAIDAFEKDGCSVLVIDSGSHEWEGQGSVSEIAEQDKNKWNRAKRLHKRFVNRLLFSRMSIIVCLRAREKEKIIAPKDSPDGKEHHIPLGMQPVAEKNFVFEMVLSFMCEADTHFARPVKVPEQFAAMFSAPRLLTKADGEAIRRWNEGAKSVDEIERLKRMARAAASDGVEEYKKFWAGITKDQRAALALVHEENKRIAGQVDAGLEQTHE